MSERRDHGMQRMRGHSLAPGYGEGHAVLHRGGPPSVPARRITRQDLTAEVARFERAVARAAAELEGLRLSVIAQAGRDEAAIFEVHLAMLEDPVFADRVRARIREDAINAERAIELESEALADRFGVLTDPYLRERVLDVRDVARRLQSQLIGASSRRLRRLPPQSVLVATELLPSETVDLDRSHVSAIVTELGSGTSHSAILACALGIPAVGGVSGATRRIAEGASLLVDGERGEVILAPSARSARRFAAVQRRYERASEAAEAAEQAGCTTADGEAVVLRANIGRLEEVSQVHRHHLEGIGLFRTELQFLEAREAPSADAQAELYAALVRRCAGLPVTVRTLDLGGDKVPAFLTPHVDRNPSLGLRGLRFSLAEPQLFDTQLEAVVRAAGSGPVRLVFPMVMGAADLRAARERLERVVARTGSAVASLEVGAMVETPAAVFSIEDIVQAVDFVSIGTNDLAQFTLATDRLRHERDDCSVLHPSLLRALAHVVGAAQRAGVPVAVCGEAAGDPATACLLVGLGIRELSMSPARAPRIRFALRSIRAEQAHALGEYALRSSEPRDVRAALDEFAFARPEVRGGDPSRQGADGGFFRGRP